MSTNSVPLPDGPSCIFGTIMHHNCHLFSSLYLSEGRRGHKRRNKPRKNPHDLDDPRLQDLGFDLPAAKTDSTVATSSPIDIPERPRRGKGRGKPRKFMKVGGHCGIGH